MEAKLIILEAIEIDVNLIIYRSELRRSHFDMRLLLLFTANFDLFSNPDAVLPIDLCRYNNVDIARKVTDQNCTDRKKHRMQFPKFNAQKERRSRSLSELILRVFSSRLRRTNSISKFFGRKISGFDVVRDTGTCTPIEVLRYLYVRRYRYL